MRRVALFIFPVLAFLLMRLLWLSYRKKYHFIQAPIKEQCIAITWHGELLIAPPFYRKLFPKKLTSAIISQHHDGDIIAKILKFFNILPLRGSSSRGSKSVLLAAMKSLKEGSSVLLTPDGPKGPRYSMNAGAIALALHSKLPLLVVNYQPKNYWQLKSWDKFLIPKPFTTLDIYHQIVHLDGMSKEEGKLYLQEKMNLYSIS